MRWFVKSINLTLISKTQLCSPKCCMIKLFWTVLIFSQFENNWKRLIQRLIKKIWIKVTWPDNLAYFSLFSRRELWSKRWCLTRIDFKMGYLTAIEIEVGCLTGFEIAVGCLTGIGIEVGCLTGIEIEVRGRNWGRTFWYFNWQ